MILKLEDFSNLEKVTNAFQSVNGLGEANCIIVALDREYNPTSPTLLTTNSTIAGARMGGVGGAIVGGIVASSIQNSITEQLSKAADSLKNQDLRIFFDKSFVCGWILNFTEKGIGFIPMTNNKKLLVKLEDLTADTDSYVFVENQDIKKMELKNKPLNFKKDKKILTITFNDGDNIQPVSVLTINTKIDVIKYQETNYIQLEKIINNK